MLKRVHVHGFKSLEDVEVDLGRLNVVIGSNGSGKTNLLEAIGLAGAAVAGQVDDAALKYRGVRPGLPALYKTAFKGDRIRRVITLELASEECIYRVTLDNPIHDPEKSWRFNSEAFVESGHEVATRSPRGGNLHVASTHIKPELDPLRGLAVLLRTAASPGPLTRFLRLIENYAVYTPYTPVLRGTSDDERRDPLGLSGGGLADAVFDIMNDREHSEALQPVFSLIDWADAVRWGTAADAHLSPAVRSTPNVLRFRDRHMARNRNWLSGYDASEGALYVTFMLVLAAHPRAPDLLAVDNVDQALNPRLARALIERIQELLLRAGSTRQVLLTAHNPLALDALDLSNDDVRLFIADRSRKGRTSLRRLPHDEALGKAKAKGMTLSRLWLSGALGGMPNI